MIRFRSRIALFATSTLFATLPGVLGPISAASAAPEATRGSATADKGGKPQPEVKEKDAAKESPREALKGAVPKDQKKPIDDDPLSDDTITGPAAGTQTSGPAAQKTGPAVLVLPFQPIFRSVPQAKIQQANDLLAKELNQKDNIQVLRGGVGKGEAAQPSLDAANVAMKAAAKAEAEHDILAAINQRKKALEELEKNAAAVEPDDYILAQHLLARAQMWAGLDKEANDTLEVAARLRPGFLLEPTEFSRMYRRWFQKAVEKAMAEKPADLMVRSALPGAQISLDGRAMDTAPVMLRKVVPGRHLLGARIDGVAPFAAVVDVKPGKANEFTVTFANVLGGPSVGIVADSIAENTFPRKAVEAAVQAGKEAGAAYVVAGGLARDEANYHVHAFVVDVGKGRIIALDVVDYDLEMLTAEHDVLTIAQGVAATSNSFGPGESAITVIDKRAKSQPVVNEVVAAPSIAADEKKQPGKGDGKKPVRDVFKPLKGTKVQIKDEESEQ